MKWDLYPQETIEFIFMDSFLPPEQSATCYQTSSPELELLQKLQNESFFPEEFEKITKFIFELDEKHPTFLTGLCKKLLISLAKEKVKAKLIEQLEADSSFTSAQTKKTIRDNF